MRLLISLIFSCLWCQQIWRRCGEYLTCCDRISPQHPPHTHPTTSASAEEQWFASGQDRQKGIGTMIMCLPPRIITYNAGFPSPASFRLRLPDAQLCEQTCLGFPLYGTQFAVEVSLSCRDADGTPHEQQMPRF